MSKGKIISFRVADEHYAQLLARSTNGGSPGSYARELMLQALHTEQVVGGVQVRLDRQEEQVNELRQELRKVLRSALVVFGRFSHEQAKDWVEQTLKG